MYFKRCPRCNGMTLIDKGIIPPHINKVDDRCDASELNFQYADLTTEWDSTKPETVYPTVYFDGTNPIQRLDYWITKEVI